MPWCACRGPGSVQVTDAVFRPNRGKGLAQTPPGHIRLGHIGKGLGDKVVAVVLDEPVEAVELECHGGLAAVELVLDALERAGAEHPIPRILVEAAAADAIAAEATLDLGHAPTVRTAEILLEQSQGALRHEIAALIHLIDCDESTVQALLCLDELIGRTEVGLRLLTGWRVVIAGRPNVGKSRLLNALAGFTRAIVDPTPGTTADVVTLSIALDGWPIELSDTAGLREPATQSKPRASLVLIRSKARPTSSCWCSIDPSRSSPLTVSWSLLPVAPSSWRINRTCQPRGNHATWMPNRSPW